MVSDGICARGLILCVPHRAFTDPNLFLGLTPGRRPSVAGRSDLQLGGVGKSFTENHWTCLRSSITNCFKRAPEEMPVRFMVKTGSQNGAEVTAWLRMHIHYFGLWDAQKFFLVFPLQLLSTFCMVHYIISWNTPRPPRSARPQIRIFRDGI